MHKPTLGPGRLMPDPYFVGSAYSTTLGQLLGDLDGMGTQRPLAPGERKLKWFVLPAFQRPPVWTLEQKIRFLESVWGELPIGCYIWNRAPKFNGVGDAWLIDGQQRVSAIAEYEADGFKVHGYLWSELTVVDQRVFKMKTFPSVMTQISDTALLEDIYMRLAYGGTAHE